MVQALSQSQLQALGPQWQLLRVSRYRGRCNTRCDHRWFHTLRRRTLSWRLSCISLPLEAVSLPMPWFTTVMAFPRSFGISCRHWSGGFNISLGLLNPCYAPCKIFETTQRRGRLVSLLLHAHILCGMLLPIRLEWLESHSCFPSLFNPLWIPLIYKQLLLFIWQCSYKTGDWHVITGLFISRRECFSRQFANLLDQFRYGFIALPAPTTELTLVHADWLKAQC